MVEQSAAAPSRRDHSLRVRLQTDEDRALQDAARAAGRSVSAHARHVLICGLHETRWHEVLPFALRHALGRIGVNLHQLRRRPAAPALHAEIVRVHERLIARLNADLDRLYPQEPDAPDAPERPAVRAVRLSGEQRAVIEGLAAQAGLSLSAYARAMLLDGKVVTYKTREVENSVDPELLRDQGQALNRIARAANSDEAVPDRAAGVIAAIDVLLDGVPGIAPR
jgi:hypothetical protein